ncbi:MAG: saccharopine dehydrogenase NADP-binding domain-containing protein [Syntrophales bacterium]|nr:saccharopine dehydrogenase NADP-binding domain-containing protein [Syntrophales bacterium]MDD5640690.1 saccharopine dehydrogenase NADP-binding domain-containing protein [Syntrophales bacterium]
MTPSKILLLGAGAMGNIAAQTVASFPEAGSLLIADYNLTAAQTVASACGAKAQAAQIDVTNRAALLGLMGQADLVMNCVGPFFRFGVPVLEAAIEAGIDYLDICDDPEPTKAMHELHDQAQKANMTAIIGLGASPGITSMLAARAREELEETEELIAAWNIEEDAGGDDKVAYSAAVVHWMQQCSGTILECDRGQLVENKPLVEIAFDYPGLGKRTVYTVGHPEPVSFHFSYPDLQRSFCVMVMPGLWIDEFRELAAEIDRGGLTLEEAGEKLVADAGVSSLVDKIMEYITRLFEGPRLPLFFAQAKGKKGGRPARVTTSIRAIPPGMAKATGIPLALGTRLFLQGKVAAKGVIAPEIAFRTEEFFDLLASYCTFPEPREASELVEVAKG